MKIALVGAACTGKTTTFDALRAMAPDAYASRTLAFVDETARRLLAESGSRASVGADMQVRILLEVMAAEGAAGPADLVICDRSVLDPIVYLFALGEAERAQGLLDDHAEHLRRYTRLFLFDPTGVPYVEDDVRRDGDAFRDRVHREFPKRLQSQLLPWELVAGDRSERVATIRRWIDREIA